MSEYAQDWEQCRQNVPAFHDVTRFKHCTDLNLFKYALNVIQNWEMDGYFLLAVMVEGDESSRLRMAN